MKFLIERLGIGVVVAVAAYLGAAQVHRAVDSLMMAVRS